MYVCQHILSEMGHASTKLHYEPISFSVKRRFPLGVLSFPWLPVSAVPLLSKKGLRYLLYPFISLWMVGGRISPSFTSALSNELSNNLRTKTDRGGEREKKSRNKSYFSFLFPLCIYQMDSSLAFTESAGYRLSSTASLTSHAGRE